MQSVLMLQRCVNYGCVKLNIILSEIHTEYATCLRTNSEKSMQTME